MKLYGDNVISNRYLAVDIETTCLDPNSPTAGIVEVYAGIYENGVLDTKINQLYYHPNSQDTYEFHKISKDMLVGKPTFGSDFTVEILGSLVKECCDRDSQTVFMSHYVPFEYQWFEKFLDVDLTNLRVCDPRDISKIAWPDRPHNLISCAKDFCGIVPENGWAFHRAESDTRAMIHVFEKCKELLHDDICRGDDYTFETYHYDLKKHFHD